MLNRLIAVAPMMDWTDRHCRYFLRLISSQVLLYTEMVTCGAILHGNRQHLLAYHPSERPLALQLGGSEPAELAECAKIAADYGYDEINLNVGCPSDRVQSGKFGACLMAEPNLVAECVAAMRAAVTMSVTVKTRIGIDQKDSYSDLCHFIQTVAASGCKVFIIHARKAWLSGLSPKENREIPPLRYDVAYQLKQDFPHLNIILNGGITTAEQIAQHLHYVDGVMLGRAAYHNPFLLAELEQVFFEKQATPISRIEVIEKMLPYIEEQLAQGVKLNHITRHILGLFHEVAGARHWRRYISEQAHLTGAGVDVLKDSLKCIVDYSR